MDLSFNGLTSLNTTLHALKNLPTLSNLLLIGNPLFVSSNGIFYYTQKLYCFDFLCCKNEMGHFVANNLMSYDHGCRKI